MKSLNQYISEGIGGSFSRPTILHFKNIYAWLLYQCEYSGQISDGKYENAKPTYHWEWLRNATCVIDGREYYEGPTHIKRYTFSSWDKDIKGALEGKSSDYDFAVRDFDYCRLASIFSPSKVESLVKEDTYKFMAVAEAWGNAVRNNWDFETMMQRSSSYQLSKLTHSTINNEKNFQYFVESKYSFRDFVDARKSAEATINTFINDAK